MPSQNKIDARFLAPLRRFAAVTALSWAMMALYMFINRRQVGVTFTTVEMPPWVPFRPEFFLPYTSLLLLTWLLPVTLQNRDRFHACLRAYLVSWLLVCPWWVLAPTMLLRPPMPDGLWAPAFAWLWKVDHPYNVTPCAHAVGPIIAAWFVAREYPAWRWPLIAFLLVTLPSIALVWQHRPIDILLGAVAAAIGIAMAETLAKKARTRATPLSANDQRPETAATSSAIDA
jgi:hypothetical protein